MSDMSVEFLSLSRRRSSSQNVASGEERGEMATNFIYLATQNFSENPATFNDFLACVSKHFQN